MPTTAASSDTNIDSHQAHKDHQAYLDERRALISAELEVSSRFDKGILTLSGGALLLSMTFVKDIASKPHHTWWLLYSWLLLGGAICMMLASLLTSQSGLRRARVILEKKLDDSNAKCRNGWGCMTNLLNIASILAFVAALVFMVLFVAANMPGK